MTDLAEKYVKDLEAAVAEGRIGERGEILPTAPAAKPAEAAAAAPAEPPAAPASAAPAPAEPPKPGKGETAPAASPAAPAPEKEPDGVQAKDGKHILPFGVLRETRENLARTTEELDAERTRREQLEQTQQGLQDQLTALKAQLEKATPGSVRPDAAAAAKDPLNPLAGLDPENYPPELVESINGLVAKVKDLSAQLEDLGTRTETREIEELEFKRDTVQESIDRIPELASWQGGNAAAWSAAQAHDLRLRQNSAWADKPIEERFKKVVELTRLELDLPAFQKAPSAPAAPAAPAAAAAAPTPKPLPAAEPPPPTSLSQIPGGAPPATTEGEALVQMDGLKGAAMLSKMTPKAMEEFLVKQFGG